MQFTNGWLAFELGVLRRLKFTSVALPFTGEGEICVHLKNWKVRVAANDPMLWSYTKAQALVENNTEQLNEDDLYTLLDDDLGFEPYAIVLARGDAGMRLAVNRALSQIYQSDAIVEIFRKTFGADVSPTPALLVMYGLGAFPE